MFDNAQFYANVPESLQKSHTLLEAYIASYAEISTKEAKLLQVYREKRSASIREALKGGIGATVAGDVARGDCAKEKAEWMVALSEKQQCKYNISSVQDRIYTIRHLSSQIEKQIKTT